jgi:hypothetical protein
MIHTCCCCSLDKRTKDRKSLIIVCSRPSKIVDDTSAFIQAGKAEKPSTAGWHQLIKFLLDQPHLGKIFQATDC